MFALISFWITHIHTLWTWLFCLQLIVFNIHLFLAQTQTLFIRLIHKISWAQDEYARVWSSSGNKRTLILIYMESGSDDVCVCLCVCGPLMPIDSSDDHRFVNVLRLELIRSEHFICAIRPQTKKIIFFASCDFRGASSHIQPHTYYHICICSWVLVDVDVDTCIAFATCKG